MCFVGRAIPGILCIVMGTAIALAAIHPRLFLTRKEENAIVSTQVTALLLRYCQTVLVVHRYCHP